MMTCREPESAICTTAATFAVSDLNYSDFIFLPKHSNPEKKKVKTGELRIFQMG